MIVRMIIGHGRPSYRNYVIDGKNVTKNDFIEHVKTNKLIETKPQHFGLHTIFEYVKIPKP